MRAPGRQPRRGEWRKETTDAYREACLNRHALKEMLLTQAYLDEGLGYVSAHDRARDDMLEMIEKGELL